MRVRHLEDPADVRRLGRVEEQLGLRGVRVQAVDSAQHPERDQGVEEIARAALMETEAAPELVRLGGTGGESLKDAELDGAQEGLRAPEGEAELEDPFWRRVCGRFRCLWLRGGGPPRPPPPLITK